MQKTKVDYSAADFLAGCLKNGAGDVLRYFPLEASRFRLTILTESALTMHEIIKLSGQAESVDLSVVKIIDNYQNSGFTLCKLLSDGTDTNIHVEKLYKSATEFSSAMHKPELRAARFCTINQVKVHVRTFGSVGSFTMNSQNLSKSGLLLREHNGQPVPFSLNTIIEMTIDPESEWLEKSMPCVGKVVRRDDAGFGQSYGVKLVEMDETSLANWINLVDELEHRMAIDDEAA